MRKHILTGLVLAMCSCLYGQSFEGWITYKLEALNPNPEKIPDSTWQQGLKAQFGEKGYMSQKYYYKKGSYISEIEVGREKGYQAYNPDDGLLYSWQEHADTAVTLNTRKYMDTFVEIIRSNETDTILNIPCKRIVVKSKMGEMVLWYNPDHLKMDAAFYKGHTYGHWEQILQATGSLPLKTEQKGFMTHIVQTAIEYKETPIDEDRFKIPGFREIIANPVN